MKQPTPFHRRRLILALAVLATLVLLISLLRGASSPSEPEDVSLPAENELQRPAGGDQLGIESHPQTDHGAVAATASYLKMITALGATPERRDAVLDRIVAPDAVELRQQAMAGYALLDAELAAARQTRPDASWWLRQIPVSFLVDAFTSDQARVSVWSLGLAALAGRVQATESWQTTSVDLVWRDGLWRIKAWEVASGPVPLITARQPTPTEQLLAGVGTWKEYNSAHLR